MKKILVQKFGGSSVATPEQIKRIAARIAEQHRNGWKVIVVVSAMGKTTDGLMKLAHEVSPLPNRRELDMLLSTGERISMALLSMALHDCSCPSISFTGSQAGVMTEGSHSNANIKELKPIRVEEALTAGKVVVLAGFQGVDPLTKEITTLGRGGSDTTAVAMAAHFKAERCEILKDVDGVLTADPRIIPDPTLIPVLSGDALYEMCRWGAKVLHSKSVELAIRHQVPLAIGRSDNFKIGTRVSYESSATELSDKKNIIAINSLENVNQIEIEAENESTALGLLMSELEKQRLPFPDILDCEERRSASETKNSSKSRIFRLSYTSDIDALNAIRKASFHAPAFTILPVSLAAVTAAGTPIESLRDKLENLITQIDVAVAKWIFSKNSVSVLISQESRALVVRAWHAGIHTPPM